MTIGTFTLIKNEAQWIGPHLASLLPYVDQMVFFDGNSTDGTLGIIKDFIRCHSRGWKIRLTEDRDPKDLRDDYVRLMNEALRTLNTELAWFCHPDMILESWPEGNPFDQSAPAHTVGLRSFAGEPGLSLLEITEGRAKAWKSIYRLRNPDLGAHYHGWYGMATEDVYFRTITGNEHSFFKEKFSEYPYQIEDSGIRMLHFSDVRKKERRISRMLSCLAHQGYSGEDLELVAQEHPRVTFKDNGYFKFKPAQYPPIFNTWKEELKAPCHN